jgi:RimJ/RimL family protein N-acetyltransferase
MPTRRALSSVSFDMPNELDDGEFRLVACNRDGGLSEPLIEIPESIAAACSATAHLYDQLGYQPPWIGYVATVDGVAVGGGAFVGPPVGNKVEIAYFTLPDRMGEGFATRTAGHLVHIARSHLPTLEIFAKTLPEANASTRILERLGFEQIGTTPDDEVGTAWAWLLR